ncbi:MAG: Gfo/Idh/MocA family oxidoreductase, partial [Devosiaceae bacterium]|nr:Gfo/Idh/MocA family oxidoreductase [Devosiaceae bacterium]
GQGAFIGYVHRIAARLDGNFELVAGALSSRPEIANSSAADLGLDPARAYTDFSEMARLEAARENGIQAVVIVTPNHMHFAPAKAFLEAGIHVICDKPITARLEEAIELARVKPKNGAKFLLTHNYTAYPLMRKARHMVANGELGKIRVVQVEYPQEWLTKDVENKQANWRTDPAKSGIGGCIGDIGTHAYNILRFVTGLQTQSLSADLTSFVSDRKLDDNVHIMMRFEGGARGMLWASQVAPGCENGLQLRIYGEKGGLEWRQDNPNQMWHSPFGHPRQLLTRGSEAAMGEGVSVRIPAGHPEGYLEAFATLYDEFAQVIRGENEGAILPSLADGVEGMRFISAAVQSSQNDGKWTTL